jgi:hypothetical protein
MTDTKDIVRGLQKNVVLKIEKSFASLITRVQVKSVAKDKIGNYVIKVKSLINAREIDGVKIINTKLGNGRGFISYPKPGELGLVLNAQGEYFYLGSIFDVYSKIPDKQIQKDPEGMFLINNDFGSYLAILKNEDVIIRTKAGAKIRLYNDGSFKLYGKTNHGIEVSASGVVTIRGTTINHTQSAGTWQDL